MNTGQRLGLILLYVVMAANAVLVIRLFIQIVFRAAIERHRRRQFAARNGGVVYTPRSFDARRGWANRWLPRNPEIAEQARNGNANAKRSGNAAIVRQAIALISIVIACGLVSSVAAHQRPGRDVPTSTLRRQLLDVESQETRVRMRLEEIDEQLKPESIQRELAGIGSTHPEELREHRRKLLTVERNGLQTQLDLLEEDRARIEASIAATASVEYVQPSPSPLRATAPSKPITQMISLRHLGISKLPPQKLYVIAAMFVLVGSGLILFLIVGAQKVRQWLSTNNGDRGFQTRLITFQIHSTTETSSLRGTRGVQS